MTYPFIVAAVFVGFLIALGFFGIWWNKKLGVDPMTGKELPDKTQ